MRWIIFTGTWRLTNEEVECDVRRATREVFERGDGIVTGGALGVDLYCMDEMLKLDPSCKQLRVIIPAKLEVYIKHFYEALIDNRVTENDFSKLEEVLRAIQRNNPAALLEMRFTEITQKEYDLRHVEEVSFSDEVYAFQVNNSTGTQDTIDKAKAAGLPITLHKTYTIEEI